MSSKTLSVSFSRLRVSRRGIPLQSGLLRSKGCKRDISSTFSQSFLKGANSKDNNSSSFLRFANNVPVRYYKAAQRSDRTDPHEIYEQIMSLGRKPEYEDESAPNGQEASLDLLVDSKFQYVGDKLMKERLGELQTYLKSLPEGADPNQLLEALAEKAGTYKITLPIYNQLILVYSLDGDYRRAQKIYDLLLDNKEVPNEQTYCALMLACSNGGKLDKTIEFFKRIQQNENYSSILPYHILIKAYMRHNRVQEAFEVIELMKKITYPKASTFNILIRACLKAQLIDRAWAAYDMMATHNCRANPITYTLLLSICRKNDAKKALDLFESLKVYNITPTVGMVNSLLTSLCSNPDYYDKANDILTTLISEGQVEPTAVTFSIMINGAALAKNLADARRFFLKAQQVQCDPEFQLSIYSTMFSAYSVSFDKLKIRHAARLNPDWPKGSSNLSFLDSPAPTKIEECVHEASRLIPFLEKVDLSKEPIHEASRPWVSFLTILSNYCYFEDAMRWFKIIETKFNNKLQPRFYNCMIEMCAKLHKENAFLAIMEKAEFFLAPIGPTSSLTEQEKREYKFVNLLGPRPLESIYRTIIVAYTEFNRPSEAMYYYDILTRDPTLNWKANEKRYKNFYKAVRKTSNPKLISRLPESLR